MEGYQSIDVVNEALIGCGGNWASRRPLFFRKKTLRLLIEPSLGSGVTFVCSVAKSCRAATTQREFAAISAHCCPVLVPSLQLTQAGGPAQSSREERDSCQGMGMGSCGNAASAEILPRSKPVPPGYSRQRGDLLIQLLLSQFSDRSGRRQVAHATDAAVENFIDPFDERVRVTRQRSSV